MKKILSLLLVVTLCLTSCGEDNDDNIQTQALSTFNFNHNWDGTPVLSSDFENTQYTNENGELVSLTRLRYIISDVTFTKANGDLVVIDGYKLVDVTNNDLNYSPDIQIPTGVYTNVSFTYGLTHDKNIDGIYTDLNSVLFNVPMAALGGGYHYMQFDGKYSNGTVTDAPFNYHNIRAVNAGMPPVFPNQDTFIVVNLGAATVYNDVTFNINMNIAEWFKNPNSWDLNLLSTTLMPEPNAQLQMNQNGQNVFSLGSISQ